MESIRERLTEALEAAQSKLRGVAIGSLSGGALELSVVDPSLGDEIDEAQANESREQVFATRQRLLGSARRLAIALDRLRDGEYGICVECGEPIPAARLHALPEAQTCVECQDRLEHVDAGYAPTRWMGR